LVADGIEGGTLALLAGINAAIEACDLVPEESANQLPATRAVISDGSAAIRLTLYAEAGAVAAVALDPSRAIGLAGKLIAAALPKLGTR
jgi:hypothetical protein